MDPFEGDISSEGLPPMTSPVPVSSKGMAPMANTPTAPDSEQAEKFLRLCTSGNAHLEAQDLTCAIVCFARALEVGSATPLQELHIRWSLANLQLSTHNLDEAQLQLDRFVVLAADLARPADVLAGYNSLATVLLDKARRAEALVDEENLGSNSPHEKTLRDALVVLHKLLTTATASATPSCLFFTQRAFTRLAHVHQDLGEVDEAIKYAERSVEALRTPVTSPMDAQGHQRQAEAIGLLADLLTTKGYETQQEFQSILTHRWAQAASAQEADSPLAVGRAYYELGALYEGAGSYALYYGPAKARQYYNHALTELRQLPLSTLGTRGAELVQALTEKLEALDSDSCVVM